MQPSIAPSTPIPRQETVELVYRIFGDVLVPLEQVRERWFLQPEQGKLQQGPGMRADRPAGDNPRR